MSVNHKQDATTMYILPPQPRHGRSEDADLRFRMASSRVVVTAVSGISWEADMLVERCCDIEYSSRNSTGGAWAVVEADGVGSGRGGRGGEWTRGF